VKELVEDMTKSNTYASGLPAGLYVLKKSKEDIRERIDAMPSLFADVEGNKQIVNTYKTIRRKVIALLGECFEDTCARNKCLKEIKSIDTDDVNLARRYASRICDILFGISGSLQYFVSFDDLPSCRSLLGCSVEEAIVKALDLVESGVVKVASKALSIGSEICKIKTISDVKHFYSSAKGLLSQEAGDGWNPTQIEELFYRKCEIELEYCKLASMKVAGKLTKEAMEASRLIIERFNNALER